MQVLFPRENRRSPVLGVVGALQFEIVVARMNGE
jgi:peptide subunit release factor RF-3